VTLLRHRQRALTAISPHQANSRFLIPKRLTGDFPSIGTLTIGTPDGTSRWGFSDAGGYGDYQPRGSIKSINALQTGGVEVTARSNPVPAIRMILPDAAIIQTLNYEDVEGAYQVTDPAIVVYFQANVGNSVPCGFAVVGQPA